MGTCRRVVELRHHPSGAFVAKLEVTQWRPTVAVRLLAIAEGASPAEAEADAITALSRDVSSHPHDLQVGHRFEPL